MAQKRKQTSKKKTTRKTKKPKVYIPAYKIIIFCGIIIAICMALLLVTTIKTAAEEPTLTERYEEHKNQTQKEETKENKKSDDKKVDSSAKKNETKTEDQKKDSNKETGTQVKNDTAGKSESKQKNEQKKQETSKTIIETPQVKEEKKKTETPKTNTPAAEDKSSSSVPAKETAKTETQKPATSQNQTAAKSYNFPAAVNNAQLIFVFDDGGQNLNHLKPFLELPFPITIAVLPRLPHSVESAKRIRQSGKELMLHQPMQAVNSSVNPGPGAITPDMTESQIISTLFTNINEIGPIAGFNNHEGSAITADAEKMAVVMKMASENGVFFLDSRTNKDTTVPYVARELGYSYYERNGYFLDNEKTKANALNELRRNLDIANKNGSVIMIGHIWSADFLPEFLMEVYPELKAKGYTFTTVSKSKAKKN